MKMPWSDKTGLAKAAAFFSTLLLVSIGLCGANFLGVMMASSLVSGAGPGSSWRQAPMAGLIVTAYAELLGMIVGAVGLVVVAIVFVIRAMLQSGNDE